MMIKQSLSTFWVAPFLLFSFCNIDMADAINTHCKNACVECPSDSEQICGLTPYIRTYSCMCQVHSQLCAMGSATFIFYQGPCKSPYPGLSKGLFELKGSTVRELRSKPRKYSYQESRRFFHIPWILGNQAHRTDILGHEEMCKLFFEQNTEFMKSHKSKHFLCSSVDPTKVEKIPLINLD